MSSPRLPASPVARGAAGTAARSLAAMDRDRREALAAAVAMLLVLLAPWYELTVTAPGADGHRRSLHQAMSGWQALSPAAVVCALVAVGSVAWLLTRSGATVEGLGAAGRRLARGRVDGGVLAGAGALAALLCLVSLASHPGPTTTLPGALSAAHVRFGLVLGLLVAVALAALGGRIALAAGAPTPRPPGLRDRLPHRRSDRPPSRRDPPADDEPAQFDFSLDRAPRPVAEERRSRGAARPRRRTTPPRAPR